MRISINEKGAKVFEKIKKDCEERKIPKESLLAIISEALANVPTDFWKSEIEKHTPSNFFLEQAMRDPKVAKQVVDFLRGKSTTN